MSNKNRLTEALRDWNIIAAGVGGWRGETTRRMVRS